jgi:nitroimidazol reductase NimA-like FMN-containing flavoprotein (pyridoxamine 5'-phosphate oxidase superfamily)
MRRLDREMPESFALGIADKCEWAVISMIDKEGDPYCIPVSVVRDGRYIYFHSAHEGKKKDSLKNNPKVCVCCVGDTKRAKDKFTTEFESAVIFGRADEVTDENEKIRILRLLCIRHTPDNMINFDAAVKKSIARTAVWRITIDEITGKRKKYGKDGKELKFGKVE